MGRVLAIGVFDIFQPGHLAYLETCAALGDELVVLVARDVAVTPSPIVPETSRVLLVESFRHVDTAVLQPAGDIAPVITDIDPAIIAIEAVHDAAIDHLRSWLLASGLSDVRLERVPVGDSKPTGPVRRASEASVVQSVFGRTE